MKNASIVLRLVFLLLAGVSCSASAARTSADATSADSSGAQAPPPEATALADSINALACDLHTALGTTPGNLVASPLSISAAMGLVYAGAGGGTRAEMRRALHLPADDTRAYEGYRTLFGHLDAQAARTGARWTLANRMWVQKGMALLPAYVATTRKSFRSEAGSLDFMRAAEPARETMNRWVEEKTENRIRDLFPQGSITGDTRLVLANAIHFKGRWATPFDKENTRPKPFHVDGGDGVEVPTMFLSSPFRLVRIAGARLVDLPYKGDALSMIVLLPDSVDGLPALEARLDPDSLRAWTTEFRSPYTGRAKVSVALPRFTATSRFDLSKTLAGLGMPSAFVPGTADLSGITGGRELSISLVVHQAFVEVNEEGTEAAAATGAVATVTSAPRTELFQVDRPFLFFILERSSGCILFAGRIVDPRGGP